MGLAFFFPWFEPAKAVLFYPVFKGYLKTKGIESSCLWSVVAGTSFGLFTIFGYFLAVPLGHGVPLFCAQFLCQSVVAVAGIELFRIR